MKKVAAKKPTKKTDELELDPDAWPKFEALIKSAAKMGPKPHGSKLGNNAITKPAKKAKTK